MEYTTKLEVCNIADTIAVVWWVPATIADTPHTWYMCCADLGYQSLGKPPVNKID